MTELATIEEGKFSAVVVHDGVEIVVKLVGNADVSAKPHLGALLSNVHEQALQHRVARVQVDLRELAFMNSSCFKDLISWLDKVREVGASGPYQVLFLSRASLHWQRRSLHALSCFAQDLVTIKSV